MFVQFINDNLLSILFFTAVIVYSVASVKKILREGNSKAQTEQIQTPEPVTPNQLIFYGNKPGITDEDIEDSLNKWQPYYKNLQPFLQQKFLQRVKEFMQQKIFVIHSKDGYKEMPILISAAAIQVSFGLNDFLFPWFTTIEIFTEEFYDSSNNKIINGEVDGNSIAIAWNQFLKGYADSTDGKNVGVHEMAHALYYQKMVVDKNDDAFIAGFAEVMKQAEKIYATHNPQQSLFSSYAYKNMQEFWAQSVEIFFEDPTNMQINYNGLFTSMKALLNQEPRNSVSPVLS